MVRGAARPELRAAKLAGVSQSVEPYPGQSLGLPEAGIGSLASWGGRLGALVIDWGACLLLAVSLFGTSVIQGHGWQAWMPLALYFVEKSILTALVGSSFGQLFTRVGVMQLDGQPIGWWRSVVRAASVCLVVPAVVIGAERRGLNDVLLRTVVVNRRT